MEEKIKLAFYGDASVTAFFAEPFRKTSQFDVVESTCHAHDLDVCFANHPHLIAVVCFVDVNARDTDLLFQCAAKRRVKMIAICDNVQCGFAMLQAGAADMLVSKDMRGVNEMLLFFNALEVRIKNVHKAYFQKDTRILKNKALPPFNYKTQKTIAIGSSTGGTETVNRIICKLPKNMPPILIVQHMPPVFTKLYAERLNQLSELTVWEARDGDELTPGLVLIAPGEQQMKVVEKDGKIVVSCQKSERVNGHCPSVDFLFHSMAEVIGKNAIGVILTGMGNDGAQGLLAMHKKGAYTIGQNEESSVVYGMPKVAFELGAVDVQANFEDIDKLISAKI